MAKKVLDRPTPTSTKSPPHKLVDLVRTIWGATILKFLSVGGFCAGLSLLMMLGLTSWLQINYLISTVITIVVTNFIGFALNKYYTFRTHPKAFWREMYKYYSVMLSSYMINLAAMYVLVDVINIWYLYANMILIVALTPVNYLFHKRWSFKQKPQSEITETTN